MLTNPEWVNTLSYEENRNIKRKYWTFVYWGEDGETGETDFRIDLAKSLRDMVIPSLISPYHCWDVKEDGTIAKKHVHVIVMNEQPIRYGLMMKTLQAGCGIENLKYLQPVANLHSMMRYLCHLDDDDKVKYDPLDVLKIAGAEYVIEGEAAQELVVNYILDNWGITSLSDLLRHYSCAPSCQKWIVKNVAFVKSLLADNMAKSYTRD